MNRQFFYMLLLSVAGCAQITPDDPIPEQPEPETEYEFHDDYYYYNDEKIYLTSCEDEYVIVFNPNHKEEVLDYISKHDFSYLHDYPVTDASPDTVTFNVPDILKSSMLFWIKGKGDVSKIPHVFYCNKTHTLSNPDEHQRPHSTNRFCVLCDEDAEEDMYDRAMKYAAEFKIYPVLNIVIGKHNWVWFACTNESVGNPVELANWFRENGGFSNAEPSFSGNRWDNGWDY